MALGGGPGATTIELAIYQAIRFDFDLQTGALLALWQLLLCGLLHLTLQRLARPVEQQGRDSQLALPAQLDSRAEKIWDTIWIALAALFVLPPLVMVAVSGLNPKALELLSQRALLEATFNSLTLASGAAVCAFVLGSAIVLTSRFWRLHGYINGQTGLK